MKHKIDFIRKILRLLYEMFFLSLIVYFINSSFAKGTMSLENFGVILALFLMSYFLRDKAPSNWIILLIHVVSGVLICFLPFTNAMIFLLCCVDFFLLCSAKAYSDRGAVLRPLGDLPWPTFFACFVVYLYGLQVNDQQMIFRAYIIPVILLVLYYFLVYFDGVDKYLKQTKDVSGLPLNNMMKTNSIFVAAITFLLIFLFVLARIFHLGEGGTVVLRGLLGIAKIFVFGIMLLAKLFSLLLNSGDIGNSEELAEGKETLSREAATVAYSLEVILKLFLVILFAYIVFKIIYGIIKSWSKTRHFATDKIEAAEQVKTRDEIVKTKKRLFSARKTPEEKIRRFYKARIERNMYDNPPEKFETTKDIEVDMSAKEQDVHQITKIYEEVRYGRVKPDKELVKEMDRLTKI